MMLQHLTVLVKIPLHQKCSIAFWTFLPTIFFLQGTLIKQNKDFELWVYSQISEIPAFSIKTLIRLTCTPQNTVFIAGVLKKQRCVIVQGVFGW